MIKGIEALTLECFLAASRAGVLDDVTASLKNNYPSLDWSKIAEYIAGGFRRNAGNLSFALCQGFDASGDVFKHLGRFLVAERLPGLRCNQFRNAGKGVERDGISHEVGGDAAYAAMFQVLRMVPCCFCPNRRCRSGYWCAQRARFLRHAMTFECRVVRSFEWLLTGACSLLSWLFLSVTCGVTFLAPKVGHMIRAVSSALSLHQRILS